MAFGQTPDSVQHTSVVDKQQVNHLGEIIYMNVVARLNWVRNLCIKVRYMPHVMGLESAPGSCRYGLKAGNSVDPHVNTLPPIQVNHQCAEPHPRPESPMAMASPVDDIARALGGWVPPCCKGCQYRFRGLLIIR